MVKLENVFEEYKEKWNSSKDKELLTLSKTEGVLKQSSTGRKDVSSKDKSNYNTVKKNQLVCNSMHMWEGTCGVSNCDGIVSPAYDVFSIKKEWDIDFFKYLFKTKKMINVFDLNSYGMSYSKRTLTPKTFFNIELNLPSLKEQEKISNFLTRVDNNYNKLNKELETSKQWKKGLLQRMFV